MLTDSDFYFFQEGTHTRLPNVLGAHLMEGGAQFGVWAPNAKSIAVVGDFNGWNKDANRLASTGRAGLWEGFVPHAYHGAKYQFYVESAKNDYKAWKADPLGIFQDTPPATTSILWSLEYDWQDSDWMASRRGANSLEAPMSIYEVHLGSWKRVAKEGGRSLTYAELADQLVPYVKEMGFTQRLAGRRLDGDQARGEQSRSANLHL